MTKEEILTMEAGEKLDSLVATEVMGEPIPKFTPPDALELQLAGSPVKSPQGNWLSRCKYSEGDIPTWRPLPYSTDISAAWLVVEKMKAAAYFRLGGKFCDTLVDMCPEREELVFWLSPKTICKAALIVVGGGKDEMPISKYKMP